MIFPSDKDYQETKQIMLGKEEMKIESDVNQCGVCQGYGDPGPAGQRNTEYINGIEHYIETKDGRYDPDSHRADVFFCGDRPLPFRQGFQTGPELLAKRKGS